MNKEWLVKVGFVCGVLLIACGAKAERYSFVGHRAQGMGGANAATVNDSSAQWHNPAAFGFFNRDADPVEGMVTNAITNVVTGVANMPVTNVIADAEMSDTNAVVVADAIDTNAVAAAESVSTNAVAEAEGEGTNISVVAEESDTNATPGSIGMDSILAAMDKADSQTNAVATGNTVVESVEVTNETYDITYEVVPAMIVPERASVDNAKLQGNDWGWNIMGIGAGYTMTEDMPEYVTLLGEIDFDAFDGSGVQATPEGVESMLLLGSALFGLGANPDNAFYVDATAGMNFRIGHLGFGIRGFGEVAGFIDYLDTANFGVEQSEADFIQAINDAASADGFNTAGYTYQTLTPGDLSISGSVGGSDAEAYVDFQLTQLKKDGVVTDANIADAVFLANQVTYGQDPDNPASSSIENNESTVTARGFGLLEVPISYGYAFNDNLSVGITAKGMYGTVTGTKVRFADGDSFDAAMDNLEENSEASFNFGLDLGVLYRMKMLQFAAVAHNINAPKFDGFTDTIEIKNDADVVVDTVDIHVPDYTIDPQITLGAAFIPSKRFMLEMSYDLLETGTLLKNYDIQRLSFGTELDLWLIALRLGAYNNLAADWQDWIATAGIGVNLWAVRLDVGGAYSIGENTEYEGTEIPEEARLYAAISMEF